MKNENKKSGAETTSMANQVTFTIDESLEKYRGPEFEPPKLKGIRERFKNGYTIHR